MKRKLLALIFGLSMTVSLVGCGAQGPKGEPGKDGVSIKSVTKTSNEGNIDTYTITYSDGSTSTFSVTNGINGEPGMDGIQGEPGKDGYTPEIKIGSNGNRWIDGVDSGISASGKNGEDGKDGLDGNGITSIKKTKTEGNIDTYTITYSNGMTYEFTVTNGEQGIQGIQGEPGKDGHTPKIEIGANGNWIIDGVDSGKRAQGDKGDQGEPGKDGVSVTKIEKTDTKGNVDTYTIYFNDGTTTTFTVTNGVNGNQGIQGEPGKDGHTPEIIIGSNGNWWIDGKDTGVSAKAPNRNDQYTVRYYLNGGEMPQGTSTSATVYWGNTLTLPMPTKKGHIFKGWFTGETANDKQFFNTDAVFKDLTLYAKREVGTYKLTLDLDGGTYTGPTEFMYKYGDSYRLPKNIYKKGFIFDGRTLNKELIPSSGYYSYENITLKAKFSVAINHTIRLNLNGGTYNGPKEINVQTQGEYTLPREGITYGDYVFVGWYYGAEKREDNGIYSLNEDIYLAAKWESLETYNITFDFNGGTSSSEKMISITNKDLYEGKNKLPKVTKSGYEFYGFSLGNGLLMESSETLNISELRNFSDNTNTLSLTAKYIGIDESHLGDYYRFGSYPQSKVVDEDIKFALKDAVDSDSDGYLNLGLDEYKLISTYGKQDYFKVEPIIWEVKSDKTLVSSKILDSKIYNRDEKHIIEGVEISSNNYKYSSIRAFLNGYDGSSYQVENYENRGFINLAFSEEERTKIQETLVDNSAKTTNNLDNKCACEDTNDKVFLLSYKDLNSAEYAYKEKLDRIRRPTDYAISKGLEVYRNNCAFYWTRSPIDGDYNKNTASIVDITGYVTGREIDNYSENGVLPALNIFK